MRAPRLPALKNWRSVAIALIVLAGWCWNQWQRHQERAQQTSHPLKADWVRWEKCTLVPNPTNDGDSFHILHQGTIHIVRLYFVDCPEKEWRRENAQRLQEQAHYFHREDAQSMAQVGLHARSVALQRLNAAPFDVVTRRERVYNSERIYAEVYLRDPNQGTLQNMSKLLVSEGLARIHTKGEHIPGEKNAAAFKAELLQIENTARTQQRGAWKR